MSKEPKLLPDGNIDLTVVHLLCPVVPPVPLYKMPQSLRELQQRLPTEGLVFSLSRISLLIFTGRHEASLLSRCHSGRPLWKGLCHWPLGFPPDCQSENIP